MAMGWERVMDLCPGVTFLPHSNVSNGGAGRVVSLPHLRYWFPLFDRHHVLFSGVRGCVLVSR